MGAPKEEVVNFADCYVLTSLRDSASIQQFLDTFLPQREPYTLEYEIPQMAEEPVHVVIGEGAILRFLEKYTTEPYAIYWYNKETSVCRGAMCLYTSDGKVIAGIFCESKLPDTSIEDSYLRQLLKHFNTQEGIILYKEPAPRTTADFLKKRDAWRKKDSLDGGR